MSCEGMTAFAILTSRCTSFAALAVSLGFPVSLAGMEQSRRDDLEAEGKQLLGEVGVRVRVRGKFRLSPSLHVHTTYRFLAVRVSSCGRWSVCGLAVGYGTNQGRKSRALSRRYAITATSA